MKEAYINFAFEKEDRLEGMRVYLEANRLEETQCRFLAVIAGSGYPLSGNSRDACLGEKIILKGKGQHLGGKRGGNTTRTANQRVNVL